MSTISGISSTTGTTSTATTSSTSSTASSTSSSSSSSTGVSGTGLLSSLGIGSGLDVTSIITALVNARKSGPEAQINAQTTQNQSLITGLTGLDSSLTSLQSALSKLTSSDTYTSFSTTFSDTSVGTASTLSFAVPGTYSVDVSALAVAQKRLSNTYATDAAVGAGTLDITVGSSTSTINVSSTDSLGDIAKAINSASDNPGVSATVVNGVNGSQLVLTSTKTGVANGFSVSAGSGSSSGLGSLATALNTAGSQEASDASLTIDGVQVSSASNTVTGALTGVTLNLTATGTSNVTVAQDTSKISSALQDFVSAYNSYNSTVGTLASYDPTTQAAGILLGDSTLNSVRSQISQVLSSSIGTNSIGNLANLGVTRKADGTLSLDSTKLDAALKNSPSAVQDLLAGSNGLATSLNSTIDRFTSSGGILQTRISSLNSRISDLQTQKDALDQRMQVYSKQLQQQYTALDSLVSSLNDTSSYLTQTLQALNNAKTSNG